MAKPVPSRKFQKANILNCSLKEENAQIKEDTPSMVVKIEELQKELVAIRRINRAIDAFSGIDPDKTVNIHLLIHRMQLVTRSWSKNYQALPNLRSTQR